MLSENIPIQIAGALGGAGGGGNGNRDATTTSPYTVNAGTPNTGGGGGAHASTAGGTTVYGGGGGSGVVILSYPDAFLPATSTTGSPTITNPTGLRVYTFTGSGSITF
jgi:hypothetical protein